MVYFCGQRLPVLEEERAAGPGLRYPAGFTSLPDFFMATRKLSVYREQEL